MNKQMLIIFLGFGGRMNLCRIALVVLLGRFLFAVADPTSAVCPPVSVTDSFLGFPDWGSATTHAIDFFPVTIIEGGEVSLQKAVHMVHTDYHKYVAVLFYASWCPFSMAFRPTFSMLASLYPSISHLAIEESAVRPSIISKYGVHGFPALFILNSTIRVHYHGHRCLSSVATFYSEVTGIRSDPMYQAAIDKVGCQSNYEKPIDEENCPFSWARSPENLFRQETYLALATTFVLLRLAYLLSPYVLDLVHFARIRYIENMRLSRVWEHPLAFINNLASLPASLREPSKRSNLHEGARAARTWASKSLASAVPIGDPTTSRGTSLGEGQ